MALLLAVSASAAVPKPDCLHDEKGNVRGTVEEVEACQDEAEEKLAAEREKAKKPLTRKERRALRRHQRVEITTFLRATGALTEPPSDDAPPNRRDRRPEGWSEDISELEQRSREAAGDGSMGVSPGMAADMRQEIMAKQGFISPEMDALLKSVSQDGGQLTPETMKKLQQGLRAVKGAGLDSKLDPETEGAILGGDFDADKPHYEKGKAQQPGSM